MQKRILIVCDDPTLNTGYARVGRFVATTLHNADYKVRYLPCNAVIPEVDRKKFGFDLDPFNAYDRYWSKNISGVLTQYKPALVMVFGEFTTVGYVGNICRQYGIRSLYYYPVEGNYYPPAMVYVSGGQIDYKLTLMKFNYIVAYSEFGARNINALLPGIVTATIPHQVDTAVFRALDRKACLTLFFPNFIDDPNIGMDKLFIVGHIGRNHRRKGTDYVLQGFASFAERYAKDEWKKPILFLTTDPKDTYGYNLYDLVKRYGLGGRVIITPVIGGRHGPEDNHLCEIYNTFDVALFPHRGEGFGLGVMEALACGIRTLTTDYATPAEFGKDVCTFVKPIGMEPLLQTGCEWAVLNPHDIGTALGKLYYHEDATKTSHLPSMAVAQAHDCKIVAQKWLRLLSELNLPDMADIEEVKSGGSAGDVVIQDYLTTIAE